LKIESNGTSTGSNDLDSIGIEDTEGAFGLRADFKWFLPHVTVTTQKTEWSGNGTLDNDISEGGVTIPAGTAVSSDLDLGIHKAVLTFDLLPTDNFELGIGFGVTALDFNASVRDPGSNAKVSTDETVPLPLLAARAGVGLGRFHAEGLLAGIAYQSGGDDVQYVDLDLAARVDLFGSVGFTGSFVLGYRYIGLDAKYSSSGDDIRADMTFTGPYVGLAFGF
jgi:hypothetical protein